VYSYLAEAGFYSITDARGAAVNNGKGSLQSCISSNGDGSAVGDRWSWIDVFACWRKIKDTNGAPIGSLALAHAATPVQ